jgi:hypothetical protein
MRLTVILAALLFAPLSQANAQSFDAKALRGKPEVPPAKPGQRAGGMKACPEYGAGFYRIDGSSTCVRVGGSIGTDVGGSTLRR